MSFMWYVGYVIIALVIVKIFQWSNPNSKCSGKLPPGSMGLPIIGETVEFFKPSGLLELPPFFQKRMLRYGPLFRTNVLGSRTVILTDADVIFEIFRQENQSFVYSYPEFFVRVIGKDNVFFKTGDIHKHIKQTTLHLIGSEALKRKMIGIMNQATHEHLRRKASQGTFDLRDDVSKLIVSYMTPQLISNLEPETQAKLKDNFKAFNIDWFQSPFLISTWKNVYKVLRAYRESTKVIKKAIEGRKYSKEKQGDFLDILLEEMEKEGSVFNQASVKDILLTIGLVSRETASSITALTVNFISKNPRVLVELKKEHEAIIQKRDGDKEGGLRWEEYRYNMTFTNMVINESLRLSNLGSVLFRKALKDVEIKGYTIPAGWIVAVAPSVVHYNSEIYENPLEFNPWRWKGKDLRSGSKTLMVFGGGMRQCVGADFARLHLAIFLHHLITTYDFSVDQECEIIRSPYHYFIKELLINISPSLPCEHSSSKSK